MTDKDRVVKATDEISEALRGLCRINYDNSAQTRHNMTAVAALLRAASRLLSNQGVQS